MVNARSVLGETSAAVFSLSHYLGKCSGGSTGISEFHWCHTWAEGDSAELALGPFSFSALLCTVSCVLMNTLPGCCVGMWRLQMRINKKLQQIGGNTFPPLCWHVPPLFTVLFLFQVTGRESEVYFSLCLHLAPLQLLGWEVCLFNFDFREAD